MKKLNIVFSFTAFAFLLISPFLTGCAEGERELMSPNTDLPESVTITVEAPAEAAFKMVISTDYRTEKDNFGNEVILRNDEKEYAVTEDFNKTLLLDSEEPRISVKLKCTAFESDSGKKSDSVRLVVKFNGEGNFDFGNHDQVHIFSQNTLISLQSSFSRYGGSKKSFDSFLDE